MHVLRVEEDVAPRSTPVLDWIFASLVFVATQNMLVCVYARNDPHHFHGSRRHVRWHVPQQHNQREPNLTQNSSLFLCLRDVVVVPMVGERGATCATPVPPPPPGPTPVLTVQTTRTHDPHVRRGTTCTAKPLPNGLRIEVPHPLERVSLHDALCLLGASGKAGDLSYDVVGPGLVDEPPRPFSAAGQLRRVHEQDR